MGVKYEPSIYLHAHEKVDDNIFEIFENFSNGDVFSVNRPTGNNGLPPSSVQRFLDPNYGGDNTKL